MLRASSYLRCCPLDMAWYSSTDVTVDLIQPTGSRTYATFRLNGSEVVAELQAHDVERPGEQLTLNADMNRAILIDPTTERVL
jgi:multiple sugar transport system ATP-binding protein